MTDEELVTCPECLGSGEYGSKKDQWCRKCNGNGWQLDCNDT